MIQAHSSTSRRAVFLDRDGTLIVDKDYLHRPEEVEFVPGAVAALKRLQSAGFVLVLVTNQSGVGRGYFTLSDLARAHALIGDLDRAQRHDQHGGERAARAVGETFRLRRRAA